MKKINQIVINNCLNEIIGGTRQKCDDQTKWSADVQTGKSPSVPEYH